MPVFDTAVFPYSLVTYSPSGTPGSSRDTCGAVGPFPHPLIPITTEPVVVGVVVVVRPSFGLPMPTCNLVSSLHPLWPDLDITNKLEVESSFIEKVLKKLFPNVPNGQDKIAPVTLASEETPEKVKPKKVKVKTVQPFTDGDAKIQSERRLYTVSLPPVGYIPDLPELNIRVDSENSSSNDDREDEDLHDQPKRKRFRKHKSKKNLKLPKSAHVEQAELEKQQRLLQEKIQPQYTDGPTISKNKKRKLKKKQQIKKKKAAGLLTKAPGINFMYQPEESNSEQEELRNTDEEDAKDTNKEDVKDTSEEDVNDTNEEDVKSINEKADGILNFLKSTQEIYFYDSISKDSDSAVFMEATEELFKHLESHSVSPSDVFILDHMKALLLLQDTERLKSALEMFPEHCMMPLDHVKIISTFFNYWITHILPERNSE
ncbi:glutamate-rich protein 1 [Orycteropus afer afer]|uniref:Glutamate-rich protein 1 n=1 Tax=Orycteropus afer afer TaxID=1230840 RepID=A0A8B7A3U8_ORYAF|nr:glutamate-rich protein 1 [Orycteropus afer afer]